MVNLQIECLMRCLILVRHLTRYMKVLYLNPYFYPENVASSYLGHDVREALVETGAKIVLYTPTPSRGVSDDIRKEYKTTKKHEVWYNGKMRIHRFSLMKEGKNPVGRALRYLVQNIKQFNMAVFAKDARFCDVMLIASTPPTQGVMAAFVKKIRHIPFVYNLQDIFPDSLVHTGLTRKGSLLWKIGRKIEDFTYRSADKIIVISEDFKKNIIAKGVPENKIVVVPNWADTEDVYPIDRKDNILIKRYNLDLNKFYITYSGNIGYTQNMDMLLDTAKEITNEDIRFILIGEGAAKENVERRVKEEQIENVIMLPFQPYEDIAHVFSLGDAGLIISKPGVSSNSVPSKTWSIMAAERPILASFDKDSELCRLIEKVGCGVTVQAGDKEALKEKIEELYNQKEKQMGKKGREYLQTYLNKDKCVGMYVETLKSVCR